MRIAKNIIKKIKNKAPKEL